MKSITIGRGVGPACRRAGVAAFLALGLLGAVGPAIAQDEYPDEGDFYITDAEDVTDEDLQAVLTTLEEDSFLEDIVEGLNENLNLPVDISIAFSQCGQANAFFDPETTSITLCLEMFTEPRDKFAAFYETDEEIDAAIRGSVIATTYHEVGHAMVSVMEIPITGKEEDAVDQFAVWWLAGNEEGDLNIVDAALDYYVDPDGEDTQGPGEDEFADEHSLGQQRYYNFLCWVYGSDTTAHADLLEEAWLTSARADRCEGEYTQLASSWDTLMAGRLKE